MLRVDQALDASVRNGLVEEIVIDLDLHLLLVQLDQRSFEFTEFLHHAKINILVKRHGVDDVSVGHVSIFLPLPPVDAILVDHMTRLEVLTRVHIQHDAFHDEVHLLFHATAPGDDVVLVKGHALEVDQVLRIEVVVPVLEEREELDGWLEEFFRKFD